MYPREHTVISAAATLGAAFYLGLPAQTVLLWTGIGAVAGVLIDADHLPLAIIFKGKVSEGVYWMRHPVEGLLDAKRVHESIDVEDELILYRLVSHVLILGGVLVALPFHPLVLPVAVALTAHIAADIVWDFYVQDGFPYL